MNNEIVERVFITGASSGIGAELAKQYASRGATLGLVARTRSDLEKLVGTLPNTDRHRIYAIDVTNHDALADAANDFIADGGIDVVIASAGISFGTFTEYAEDMLVFEKIIAVNLVSVAATFTPFIAALKERAKNGRQPRLVGIASMSGSRGFPGKGAYSASKAGVIKYCESLRLELKKSGIKVVTISPSYIDTPMTKINTYSMPFLMPVEDFAKSALIAIDRGISYIALPWQMGIIAKFIRVMPNWMFDILFAKTPVKRRANQSSNASSILP